MRERLFPSLRVLVAVLALPVAARAQEAPLESADGDAEAAEGLGDLESLLDESVVTTASRSAERASTAPATVFTISGEDIHRYGIRTVDEALNFLGISVYSTRTRDYTTGLDVGAQGVMFRDGGRRILVLVDGHVWNSQDTGQVVLHEGLGVPLEAISHLEVMLGAGSVMYGSNAMLAVINVVTRGAQGDRGLHAVAELQLAPPQDEEGRPTGPDAPGARVGLRYRFGVGVASVLRVLQSPAEIVLRAEWLEDISNSYAVPFFDPSVGFQVPPGGAGWGGTATHALQAPSVFGTLRVGDFRLMIQANYFARDMPFNGVFMEPRNREERGAARIELRHDATLDPHVTLATRLYADFTAFSESSTWTEPYWCVPGQIDGCVFQRRSVGRWAGVEQQLNVDWMLDGTLLSTLGYDIRARDSSGRPADYSDYFTGEPPWTTRLPYFHTVTVLGAVFAQQVWRPIDWLTLNGGVRLDVDSIFGAHVSPRIAVSVAPIAGTTVRASYSEAFRAPTAYESNDIDPTYRIASPGLRPEIVRSVELEWQQRIEWLTFSLRGWASFYEAFVESRPVTTQEFEEAFARGDLAGTAEAEWVIRYENLSSLRTFGGSAAITARPLEGLTLSGTISVVDTRRVDSSLALQPAWWGNARIAWEIIPDGPTLTLAALFAGRRAAYDEIRAIEVHEVSEQLDLRATLSAPIEVVPGLRFRTSFGWSANPFQPYLLIAPTAETPDNPRRFYPTTSVFHGLVGLQYDLDL